MRCQGFAKTFCVRNVRCRVMDLAHFEPRASVKFMSMFVEIQNTDYNCHSALRKYNLGGTHPKAGFDPGITPLPFFPATIDRDVFFLFFSHSAIYFGQITSIYMRKIYHFLILKYICQDLHLINTKLDLVSKVKNIVITIWLYGHIKIILSTQVTCLENLLKYISILQ